MHYLSECLIIKNENQYLTEHLEENARAGVEHFYIYDNESSTPVSDFIEKHAPDKRRMCTVEVFPTTKYTQMDCYSHFLTQHRGDTKWCAFIDTDEQFEGDLLDFCKKHEEILALSFVQTMHGANGQAYADLSKTLKERFRPHVLRRQFMCKCVAQTECIQRQYPHHTDIKDECWRIPKDRWLKFVNKSNPECGLHHYYYRSFEEWLQKIRRGNVLSFLGDSVAKFFVENSIPEGDKKALLDKYGLGLDDRMQYEYHDKGR